MGAKEPRWVERLVVDAVHLDLMREHGGLLGTRDEDALESALARPRQKWTYEQPDIATLAAAYGYGLSRNHPYQDGNKRNAFVVMGVFAGLNGLDIVATEEEVVALMLSLAAGELSEEALADWLRTHLEGG